MSFLKILLPEKNTFFREKYFYRRKILLPEKKTFTKEKYFYQRKILFPKKNTFTREKYFCQRKILFPEKNTFTGLPLWIQWGSGHRLYNPSWARNSTHPGNPIVQMMKFLNDVSFIENDQKKMDPTNLQRVCFFDLRNTAASRESGKD